MPSLADSPAPFYRSIAHPLYPPLLWSHQYPASVPLPVPKCICSSFDDPPSQGLPLLYCSLVSVTNPRSSLRQAPPPAPTLSILPARFLIPSNALALVPRHSTSSPVA